MAEKSILQILRLCDQDFHKRFRKECFTSKWWLSFKVETWEI